MDHSFAKLHFGNAVGCGEEGKMFRRKNTEKSQATETERQFSQPSKVKKVSWEGINQEDRRWAHQTIYDGGPSGYSVAVGQLVDGTDAGRRVCAIRWNGAYVEATNGNRDLTGTPAAGGEAEWFVLPEFLWDPVLRSCANMRENGLSYPLKVPT